MRTDVGEAWERTPPELLAPREPLPPRRWVRVVAGLCGGVVGSGIAGLMLVDPEWGFVIGPQLIVVLPVGAALGSSLAVALTVDVQRWRRRSRAGRSLEEAR